MASIAEILWLPFEIVILLIKIWYYILEALFHLIFPPGSKDVRDKVVLITGGGGGIGRALAIEFAKHNARIVLWDINKTAVEESAILVREWGVTCEAYVCDVTNKAEVDEVAGDVIRTVGDVDILINNAGVFPCKKLMDLSEHDIRNTFEVNSIALFWTTQAFLPRMMARNEGHLVTVASIAAKIGSPYICDYGASKFAAYGMMESIRAELEMQQYTGIRCSVICPMIVNTGMIQNFSHRMSPFDRFGEILETPAVADQAVQRVLRNERYIFLPGDKRAVGFFNEVLPYKARQAFFTFTRAGFEEKTKSE